ncbi:hypothetical protein DY000_02016218 [Brassica cretica]|uniref:Uncharacterized protein n=1 Tax=Brassica cretica TaxID=69181 RepID=A0ABQ7CQG6_BRACR|nr:hypothetical protein DY000_02016218 [Brassica cretica]
MPTTIPLWQNPLQDLQPELLPTEKSIMRIMRRNELHSIEEEKDEYGIYRDDHGHARDVDGQIIRVSKDDIRSHLERASMDEHNYLCLPENARSFTQTKLVPEIYTSDEINKMLFGICGAQKKNEDDFQMKLDGAQRAAKATTPESIDRNIPTSIDRDLPKSIDDDPSPLHPMKSLPDSYTRAEINEIVEKIYRTLGAAQERLDKTCDDIYFP